MEKESFVCEYSSVAGMDGGHTIIRLSRVGTNNPKIVYDLQEAYGLPTIKGEKTVSEKAEAEIRELYDRHKVRRWRRLKNHPPVYDAPRKTVRFLVDDEERVVEGDNILPRRSIRFFYEVHDCLYKYVKDQDGGTEEP